MKLFYFTSTGNCLHIAKQIGGELYSIPSILKNNIHYFKDEAIGVIFPTYVASTPTVVENFLHKVKLDAKYIFAIATYGKITMGTIDHFKKLAKKNGIILSYTNKILMVDNSIRYFEMNDQISKIPEKKIDENIKKIADDIRSRVENNTTSSALIRGLSTITNYIYKSQIGKLDKNFVIEEHCTGCGTCQKVCPVKNIQVTERPIFGRNKCIGCFACTHNCPENAIRFKKEKSKARYRNENITLYEIIKANQ